MKKLEIVLLAAAGITGITIGWQWGDPDRRRRRKATCRYPDYPLLPTR